MKTRAVVTSLGQCANWVSLFRLFTAVHQANSPPDCQLDHCFLCSALPLPLQLRPLLHVWQLSLLTVLVCVAFQSESQGISLEGLDAIFDVSPRRKFWNRQVGVSAVRPGVPCDDIIALEAL
jgi:hypothetical protein